MSGTSNANLAFSGTTITLGGNATTAITIGRSGASLSTLTLAGVPALSSSQLLYYNSSTGAVTYSSLPTVGAFDSAGTGTGTDNGNIAVSAPSNTAAGTNSFIADAGTLAFANSAFGAKALSVLSDVNTNFANNAYGWGAAYNMLFGADNNFLGEGAGYLMVGGTSGTPAPALKNIAIGSYAMGGNSSTTAVITNNVAIGFEALYGSATAVPTNNVAIGTQALTAITGTATGNVAVGYNAGNLLLSGAGNVLIGNSVQTLTTADSNSITIGNAVSGAGTNTIVLSTGVTGAATQFLVPQLVTGTSSKTLYYNTTTGAITWGTFTAPISYGTGTGNDTQGKAIAAPSNTWAGSSSLNTIASLSTSGGTLSYGNSSYGSFSLSALLDLAANISNNAFGWGSAKVLQYGNDNNFFGEGAGYSLVGATGNRAIRNVAIGSFALGNYTGTTATIQDNIAIGCNALAGVATAGAFSNGNIAVGYNTLSAITGSYYNIALGYTAMAATTTGGSNIAIGYNALGNSTTGDSMVCIGHNAGQTAFTATAGSVFIGAKSDGLLTTTVNAICINATNAVVKSDTNEIRILTSTTYTTGTTFIGGISSASPGTASAVFINSSGQLGTNAAIATAGGALTTSYTIGANALTTFAVGGTGVTSVAIGSSSTASNTVAIGSATTTTCTVGGIYTTSPSGSSLGVVVNASGVLGAIVSSARFKDNIVPIEKSMADRIYDLEPVRFNYKAHDTSDLQYGLIAEEVHKILPEFVVYKDSVPYSVAYQFLAPALISVVKDQRNEISAQRADLAIQKIKIESQASAISTLEERLSKLEKLFSSPKSK